MGKYPQLWVVNKQKKTVTVEGKFPPKRRRKRALFIPVTSVEKCTRMEPEKLFLNAELVEEFIHPFFLMG